MADSRISPTPTKIERLARQFDFMAQTLDRVAKHPHDCGIIIIEGVTREKMDALNNLASWLVLAGIARSSEMMESGEFIWSL